MYSTGACSLLLTSLSSRFSPSFRSSKLVNRCLSRRYQAGLKLKACRLPLPGEGGREEVQQVNLVYGRVWLAMTIDRVRSELILLKTRVEIVTVLSHTAVGWDSMKDCVNKLKN